jgi:tetratricopeptide (TPR) repeat protein
MKSIPALVCICSLIVLSGCSQSPEKLLAAANKYHQNKKYQEASILYQKVILKDKTNAEAYYRQGLNLIDQGKISDAVGFLRRAVDLQPSNTDAESKLAEIYLTAYAQDPRKYKALLPDIRDLDHKILQRDPNSFEGLRLQGLVQLADQTYDKALVTFEKANKIKPHSRDLIGWYAQTLVQGQKSDQAISLVTDMLAHDKTWGQGYDFLFVQYGRTGAKDKAEAILRERVKNDPHNAVAIQNLASYLSASNRYDEAEATARKVLDDPKNIAAGHEFMGDFYARAKKYDQAMAEYKLGEKEDPKHAVRYQQRIVALYTFTGHPEQAAQLAKELAEKNPKDLPANEMYASILLQSTQRADIAKSLNELKKLVQNNPTDSVLHLDLARAYYGLNDREKALSESLEAMQSEQKASVPRPAVLVPARTVAARIYEDQGQHSKAMEQADMILAAQPANPDALLIRVRALIGTNEADKAQPELEALVQRYPKMNDARVQLAGLYMNQRLFDKAQTEFQQIVDSTPSDIRGFLGLQAIKVAKGKSAEAISAMQDMVSKNPGNPDYRFQLANFQASASAQEFTSNQAHAKQLLQQAADNYKEVLKTTPNSVDVWLRLGVMQRQLGQFDAALASFEQAGNINNKSTEAFLNQALLNDALGKKKEAADAYSKVLAIDPENALALNNLAYMTADSGANLDQAMTFAERAKKKAPNSADISDTLGFVYYQKNLNGQALSIFRQNVQEHPQNPTFRLHLAMALLKQGDKQGARDEASKALEHASAPDQQNKIRTFVNQIG